MKQKTLVRALGLTLALAPLAGMAAVENITYFGYAKWGNIYTDNDEHNGGKGERNDVIRAGQGYGNYRLGNELNWWEAGLKATFGNKATRTLIPRFTLVAAKAGATLA